MAPLSVAFGIFVVVRELPEAAQSVLACIGLSRLRRPGIERLSLARSGKQLARGIIPEPALTAPAGSGIFFRYWPRINCGSRLLQSQRIAARSVCMRQSRSCRRTVKDVH